jgi:stearoyl-CoA desaturase (Delta-9 desaturase)
MDIRPCATAFPVSTIYCALNVLPRAKTIAFAVFYYFVTGSDITAKYHRLRAHRLYKTALPLQYALALAGSGAVEGPIKWRSTCHCAHRCYTDTNLDLYNVHHGC